MNLCLRLAIVMNKKQLGFIDIPAEKFEDKTDEEKSYVIGAYVNALADGVENLIKDKSKL